MPVLSLSKKPLKLPPDRVTLMVEPPTAVAGAVMLTGPGAAAEPWPPLGPLQEPAPLE
eukprot:COSAG01_NODE_3696_length_5785_cov_17.639641_8_plen_58_part_00